MPKKYDSQKTLKEHSRVKVKLYQKYLSIYLNILIHVESVSKIYIFDLFCGEGVYEGGVKGSPLAALKSVKDLYWKYKDKCPEIEIWFNDSEESQLEANVKKIDRVKRVVESKYNIHSVKPFTNIVEIKFTDNKFKDILPRTLSRVGDDLSSKALFFLDPYGYKEVVPGKIRKIMSTGNSEVIMFMPATTMYRFIDPVQNTEMVGGAPLRNMLEELFEEPQVTFKHVYDFIGSVKMGFREYLSELEVYVDTFILETENKNVYCLFFFTPNIRGAHKMLDVKWKLDEKQGRGFRQEPLGPSLFSPEEASGYTETLTTYIQEAKDYRSNKDIYEFGIKEGYLPKHSNKVLKRLRKNDEIERFSLDDKAVKGNYIGDPDRKVAFRFKKS